MRRAAGSFRFLTYAVHAMNHRRFCRLHGEMQLKALVDRLQLLRLTFPGNLPVAIPDAPILLADAGDSRARAIRAFVMEKLAALQIAQCQVSEITVSHVPGIDLAGFPIRAAPEKCQFKSKTAAILSFHVSRVVPPFGLEVRMVKMIAGKFIAVAWKRGPILRAGIREQK